MSSEDELTAAVGNNLFAFILKDEIPCPKITGGENNLLEDCSLTGAEKIDKDMDDLITNVVHAIEGEEDALKGYLFSENQRLSPSPGSSFARSPWNSNSVHIDHNYSLPLDMSVMKGMSSDMEKGGKWMDLEGSTMALEQSSHFRTAVAMDAGPQLVPGAIVQNKEHLMNELHQSQSAQGDHHSQRNGCSLENRPLPKQVEAQQTTATQSTTRTATEKTSNTVMVLSINLSFSSSLHLVQSIEPNTEIRVETQQICEFPNQAEPDVQNTTLEVFSPEPENLFQLGNLSESQEE